MATYEIQDAFFKRIAFFVEKAGHAGRLESVAALASLHGYNAHDYRAEDLARFFTAAKGDSLSIEEDELAKILLDNGVVKKSDTGFAPGEGCILSISRSSSPLLRSLLLTHESFHGIFFSLPAFRDATEKEWESLSPEEQAVWVEYLSHNNYDTTDHYLVVNEFQSYLCSRRGGASWASRTSPSSRMRSWSAHAAALARRARRDAPHLLPEVLRRAGRSLAVRRWTPRGGVFRGDGGGSVGLGRKGNFADRRKIPLAFRESLLIH